MSPTAVWSRSTRFCAILVTAVAASMLLLSPSASARGRAYQHYAACGVSPAAKPSHVCPRRRPRGAFFRSRRADVRYTVCVRFAGGRTLCAKRQLAERGVLYVNRITGGPGEQRITWFVHGKRVGRFTLRVNW